MDIARCILRLTEGITILPDILTIGHTVIITESPMLRLANPTTTMVEVIKEQGSTGTTAGWQFVKITAGMNMATAEVQIHMRGTKVATETRD